MSENDQSGVPADPAPARWPAHPPPAQQGSATQPEQGTDQAPEAPGPQAAEATQQEPATAVQDEPEPATASGEQPADDAPAHADSNAPEASTPVLVTQVSEAATSPEELPPAAPEATPPVPAAQWSPPAQPEPVATPDPAAAAEPAQAPVAEQAQPERLSKDAQAALEAITSMADSLQSQLAGTHEQLARLARSVEETARLRQRDQEHVDAMHTDNQKLRAGELTSAMAPLLTGLVRLSDTMSSMAAGDKNSIAGMLRSQLLQTLDVAANVAEFTPATGEEFDTKTMTGAGREETTDPDRQGRVARTLRAGFKRGEAVVRPAEVVVWRLAPTPSPAPAGTEQ